MSWFDCRCIAEIRGGGEVNDMSTAMQRIDSHSKSHLNGLSGRFAQPEVLGRLPGLNPGKRVDPASKSRLDDLIERLGQPEGSSRLPQFNLGNLSHRDRRPPGRSTSRTSP